VFHRIRPCGVFTACHYQYTKLTNEVTLINSLRLLYQNFSRRCHVGISYFPKKVYKNCAGFSGVNASYENTNLLPLIILTVSRLLRMWRKSRHRTGIKILFIIYFKILFIILLNF
jgi:hypothetical protein